MKCQILFSRKDKKNISKSRLLKIVHRVLSIKASFKIVKDNKLIYFIFFQEKNGLNISRQSIQIIFLEKKTKTTNKQKNYNFRMPSADAVTKVKMQILVISQ